jgi:hypothetical protein
VLTGTERRLPAAVHQHRGEREARGSIAAVTPSPWPCAKVPIHAEEVMDVAGVEPEPDLQEAAQGQAEEAADVGKLDAFSDFLDTLDFDDFDESNR